MSITVALYSHDSVGLGHARRNRALAYALAADLPRLTGQRVRGLLIAGHPDATADSLPQGWDWLVLPGFTHTRQGYSCRSLDVSTERLWHLRSATATAALEAMSPDLFIVDRHAFGVDDELLPALETLGAAGTRCVLGMREVLDTPEVAAAEWDRIGGASAVAHYYDAVWVYGDRNVYDPVATGEIPAQLADRTRFTGYLSHGRPEDQLTESSVRAERPYVLTMVGGGSDGGHIGLAAAQAQLPSGHQHLILTGPQMPAEDHRRILDAAHASADADHITVSRKAPHVPQLVRDAAAVVSMGGYNSLAEIMATTTPALIVARTGRRHEQLRRAQALAAAGAAEALHPEKLSPRAVGDWLREAVHRRTARDAVDLDGLMRIGDFAAQEIAATPGAAGPATAGLSAAGQSTAPLSHSPMSAAPVPMLNETRPLPHVR